MSDEDYADLIRNVLVSQPCLNGAPGQPSLLVTGLYIGGQRNAESLPSLQRLGVTHVLNCAGYKGHRSYNGSPYEGLDIKYREFMADDSDHYDITQHFREAFAFIDRARKEGGVVLVHCALGINRSGATCLGYLMLMCRTNLIKAAILIKSKRRVVLSNVGFQKRLVRLARKNGLLDAMDSAYIQRFVVSKPKHRSNSVVSSHHEWSNRGVNPRDILGHQDTQFIDQLFPHTTTLSRTLDFKPPFYSSYSSPFNPSPYQSSHLTSSHLSHLNDYPSYNQLKPPAIFIEEELLKGRRSVNGISQLLRHNGQPKIFSLSRNSICFI